MKPTTIEHTGSGAGTTNSSPVRVNWRTEKISLSFSTDGSTTGFTAQYTMLEPENYASASAWATAATWHSVTEISGATAAASAVIDGPVQGIRLQADANGTDTGSLIITHSID